MPDQIFISYRRDDAAYVTGHINDLLRKEFGDAAVFTDVDNIALGVDFRAVLDETVSQCQVLLAVIGSNWLTVQNQDGQPRLQDPADFVRIEIESALQRNIPVIPLLVSGAKMPAEEELPDSLKGLAFRNGTQIRPAPDFGMDMARLIKNLQRHFSETRGGEVEVEQPPAEVEEPQEAPPEQSESSKIKMQVGAEERARRQAELGIGRDAPKKKWAARSWLVAVVVLAAASWYLVNRNPETMSDALTAVFGTEPSLDASDGVEAIGADDVDSVGEVEEIGPPDVPAEAILEPAAEAEGDASEDLTVDAPDEAADDTETISEPAADVVSETSDQAETETETEDEFVEDTEAVTAASDETAADTEVHDEVVMSPDTQRRTDATPFISEGMRLAAIGDHEGAIQNFDEAIALEVEAAFVFKQRGASYQAIGQFDAAISDYDEAIKLNAEDLNAYYNRGVSHQALRNYEAAIADYDVVIELDPEFIDARTRRAEANEALRNEEDATGDREDVGGFD